MRLNGEDLDVDWKLVAVTDDVVRVPGANRNRLAAEAQSDRGSNRGLIGEKKPDAHLYRFGFPRRLHVQVDDEIAPRFESPRGAVRRSPRTLAGRPSQHESGGVVGIRNHPP